MLDKGVDEVTSEGEVGNFGILRNIVRGRHRTPYAVHNLVQGLILERGEGGREKGGKGGEEIRKRRRATFRLGKGCAGDRHTHHVL